VKKKTTSKARKPKLYVKKTTAKKAFSKKPASKRISEEPSEKDKSLNPSEAKLSVNLMKRVNDRPLEDLAIGISISNSDDLLSRGYVDGDIARVTVRLSEALLEAGASLVFGHDWRPDGVMDVICRTAVKYQRQVQSIRPKPLILNFVPWPNQPSLDPEVRKDLEQRGVMRIQMIGNPDSESGMNKDALNALALTHMREEMTNVIDARICLGGREKSSQGLYPGVVEEAFRALLKDKPLYIAGFLGGVSNQMVQAVQQPETASSFSSLRVLDDGAYQKCLASWGKDHAKLKRNPRELSYAFVPDKLQKRSGLTPDDWNRLLNAQDVDTFATLVIRGLQKAKTGKD
jgi:hypothetical protein